jgi:hypothetical protein
MRTIVHRRGCLHVETPLGIVNIRVGLSDRRGRLVDSIEVIPDDHAGEAKIARRGFANTRLVQLKTRTLAWRQRG